MRYSFVACRLMAVASLGFACSAAAADRSGEMNRSASAFIPGAGAYLEYASDDFEDEGWEFIHRHPKSSREQDERTRGPMGVSNNDRWHEGPERGQPDQIERTSTPAGGP